MLARLSFPAPGAIYLVSQRITCLSAIGKSCGKPSASRAAQCGRIRTSARRERTLLCARARKQRSHAEVPLVTPGLLIDAICLIALLVQLQLHGPRSGPRCRILDRDGVFERVRIEPCPAFNQMQVFAGSLEVRFRSEIGDVDDQCIPLPMTAGVSPPLAQVGGKMRTPR